MPHHNPSDPALNTQFRRNWDGSPTGVRFLAELSERDLDRLAVARGEKILGRLPPALVADLRAEERRDLALAFGRPWLRRLQQRPRPGKSRRGFTPHPAPARLAALANPGQPSPPLGEREG